MKKDIRKNKKEIAYFFAADELLKAGNHGRYIALQKIRRYIKESFDIDRYDKFVFKNKLFAGIRIAMLLEYLDHQKAITEDEMTDLDDLIDEDGPEEYFRSYLLSQHDVYKEIHQSVLIGQLDGDDDDDDEV
jgi:hypothetical protein